MVEEKFSQKNLRADDRTPYFDIFNSARKVFGRKLPEISQNRSKNTRKIFSARRACQSDENNCNGENVLAHLLGSGTLKYLPFYIMFRA